MGNVAPLYNVKQQGKEVKQNDENGMETLPELSDGHRDFFRS
jgi:hypothetical protein